MKRLFKEPLLHFLILGALLFAAYSLLNRGGGVPAPGRIVISQGQLAAMLESFTRTRQRPPTPDEWEAMIRDRVREEVYCREAMAMGLDKDDTIIRRRLRQKMEFISDDISAQVPPTDEQLDAYLKAHPDQFRLQQQFTFRQVYLNPQKHGDHLARDAVQLLAQLNQPGGDASWTSLGDPFMLENTFTAESVGEIAKQFGDKFSARLVELPAAKWHGPVESGFGVHLVCISQRTPGRLPALAEVRDEVQREWDHARRAQTNESFYQELLKRYTVTIEPPAATEPKNVAAAK